MTANRIGKLHSRRGEMTQWEITLWRMAMLLTSLTTAVGVWVVR